MTHDVGEITVYHGHVEHIFVLLRNISTAESNVYSNTFECPVKWFVSKDTILKIYEQVLLQQH
jgi:hypothetical protein